MDTSEQFETVSSAAVAFPTDIWYPVTDSVQPQRANQYSVAFQHTIPASHLFISVEGYYKTMDHLIGYKEGTNLFLNTRFESALIQGDGRSYGAEILIKKESGKLTGWISYTLSRTEKRIEGINNGNYYPATQDQTHNIAVVGIYNVNPRWTLSATWVYNTGNAVSWPSGKFSVDGVPVYLYPSRNNYRMPAYNRLDLGATLLVKKTNKSESSWTFSIYNAYNRANPYVIYLADESDYAKGTFKIQAKQISLFPIIPSITYNVSF